MQVKDGGRREDGEEYREEFLRLDQKCERGCKLEGKWRRSLQVINIYFRNHFHL